MNEYPEYHSTYGKKEREDENFVFYEGIGRYGVVIPKKVFFQIITEEEQMKSRGHGL